MIFDSHTHYDDKRFDDDRDSLLSSLGENGVGRVMSACASMQDIGPILALADRYDFLYASVGVHPHEAEEMRDRDLEILKEAARHPKVKAIGEIGLDYYYDNSPRDLQRLWFAKQLELAKELDLPVIIHDRDAHGDTMDILRTHHVEQVGGVFHCYAGSVEMAKEILDWGMYIAFGGSLTFKKAVRPAEVAAYVPMNRILLETDCPYLTPEPHRGKRNDSTYLSYVAQRIAEIKGVSTEEIIKITYENASRCFRIAE